MPLRGVFNCIIALAYTVAPFLTSLVLYGTGNITNRWSYRALIVSQYFFALLSTIFVIFMPE